MPNQYVNKVAVNGSTIIDLTGDTVTAADVAQGKTFHLASGASAVGTASSGASASQKAVNFIDYDGTIVESYTVAEAQELTALPDNPNHDGLVSQGWNWNLADIKAALTTHPERPVNVGQMYVTESGDTEIDIVLDNPDYLSPYLGICPNGTVTIDWGDGSATDTLTGTSTTSLKYIQHVYMNTGSYTIKLSTTNRLGFYNGSNTYPILLCVYTSTNRRYDRTYVYAIKAIRLGNGVYLGIYAFNLLSGCKTITIPNTVKRIDTGCFRNCYALQSVTIPSGTTTIADGAFYNCLAIQSISIPNTLTIIDASALYQCHALQTITIPDSVTYIGSSLFQYCYSLKNITIPTAPTIIKGGTCYNCHSLQSIIIPDGVTSIEGNTFYNCYVLSSIRIPDGVTSIGTNAFGNCFGLQNITIPDSVTDIGNTVFQSCYGVTEYHIKPTTPPTLGTNAFANIVLGTIIYVPQGCLEAYQTATNWSTYASYMREEES